MHARTHWSGQWPFTLKVAEMSTPFEQMASYVLVETLETPIIVKHYSSCYRLAAWVRGEQSKHKQYANGISTTPEHALNMP